jgi:hypothetical protein
VESFELRDGAAQPDLARGVDVDKVERDKPVLELAVVDHEMGDGSSARVNDQAAHFAADPSVQVTSARIVNGVPATATSSSPLTVARHQSAARGIARLCSRREHQIRRDLQAGPLPAHTPGDLVRCCSAMRNEWQR